MTVVLLDVPIFNNSVMSIGKQKEPIFGERIQSMIFNHMQERSAVADAMMPSRNVGVVWNGSSPEKYSSWAFGVDGGMLPAEKIETWNAELSWRKGPFWLASEYTRTNVDSPLLGNPSFDGYFVAASWILTGEMRNYNRKSGTFGGVPVSRSVYQNGKGAWELAARWSTVNLNDGLVNGGDMDIASLALNWWATPFFSVNLNYRYIWNERHGLEDTSSGFNSRIILLLE